MAAFPILDVALLAFAVLAGIVLGWVLRARRASGEKSAISEGWQAELRAQGSEHQRLVEQNRSLMEQLSESQASGRDAVNRARELSEALKEAFARRDSVTRELKEIRTSLERAVAERDRLHGDLKSRDLKSDSLSGALKEKDQKIFRLSREIDNWRKRLPPLVERYRDRENEVAKLEAELAEARQRIESLEDMLGSEETRVEPVDAASIRAAMDASNDPLGDTGHSRMPGTAFATEVPREEAAELLTSPARPVALLRAGNGAAPPGRDDQPIGGLRDNLRQIRGIGPAIEKTLNELGIFRFSQVAAMSDYDIERIAKRLRGFRSRIEREDWIGQARALDDGARQGESGEAP